VKLLIHQGQPTEAASILKKVTPFHFLNTEIVDAVVNHAEFREVRKDTYVFRQGDDSLHTLFVIVAGAAEVTVLNEHDKEVVVGKRKELDFFGETVFLSEEPYPASVRAVEDLVLMAIPQELFETMLSRNADFTAAFSRILADRMRNMYRALFAEEESGQPPLAQPMRRRVADLMSSPPALCRPQDEITAVAAKMSNSGVSSLVVVDDTGQPVGLITEKDLVSKVLARGDFVRRLKASDIMSTNLLTVPPQAFYYEALLIMVKNKAKHVLVTDEDKLVGIVTLRDLIVSRSSGALSIVNSIEKQNTIDGLAKASIEIDKVLQALVAEKASSQEILILITEFFDRLTRKVIQVCEREMISEGYGPPPVAYSWITMGSSGRQEQFVKTDQDNGIIYENIPPEKEEEVARYFHILAEKIVEGLFLCGFAKCKGNVMASNPFWCRSFNQWRDGINQWISKLDSENVRMMTIFLDFRHVYGKKSLCDLLRNYVTRSFQKSSTVLLFLAKDDLGHRVPLNFFKQIVTEKSKERRNHVNLKGAACVHMVDCLRIFSLREGIVETNTFKRLDELSKRNVFSEEDMDLFQVAYETLMMMRIRQSLMQINRGEQPDNYVNPDELNKRDKAALREAFLAADRLQNLTGHAFYAFIG
jgi:CBS domain-containing protein